MLDAVIARLKLNAPVLGERIEGVASLQTLMASNALPQVTPAAHVIPTALRGRAADTASTVFRQRFDQAITVLLSIRTNDRNGSAALENIDATLMEIITAIAGWAPDDEVGVFRLEGGRVVSMERGTFVYEINFSIEDQLRIAS